METALKRLVARTTAPEDTHPFLEERLRALGEEVRLPQRPQHSAGEVYLGAQMRAIAAKLDAAWQASHASEWRAQHVAVRKSRQRLAELSDRVSPTAEEIFERAELLERMEGQDRYRSTARPSTPATRAEVSPPPASSCVAGTKPG